MNLGNTSRSILHPLILLLIIVSAISCQPKSTSPTLKGKSAELACMNRKSTDECHILRHTSPEALEAKQQVQAALANSNSSTNLPEQWCDYFPRILRCQNDCTASDRHRLQGFYEVCKRCTGSGLPAALARKYKMADCSQNQRFLSFADNMRPCIQKASATLLANNARGQGKCNDCTTLVEGKAGDVVSGIIGVHSHCAVNSGLCDLDASAWGCFLRPFGYAFGPLDLRDGKRLGTVSAESAIGFCHLASMGLICPARNNGFEKVLEQIGVGGLCDHFMHGCRQSLRDGFRKGRCFDCAPLKIPGVSLAVVQGLKAYRAVLHETLGSKLSTQEGRHAFTIMMESACVDLLGRNDLATLSKTVDETTKKVEIAAQRWLADNFGSDDRGPSDGRGRKFCCQVCREDQSSGFFGWNRCGPRQCKKEIASPSSQKDNVRYVKPGGYSDHCGDGFESGEWRRKITYSQCSWTAGQCGS